MIYRFGGRNFFSFKDSFEVDFTIPRKSSDRQIYHSDSTGQHLNAVTGIFGANASGKTNLLKALAFLHWFILHSAQQKPEEQLLAHNFRFSEHPDLNVDLFIDFEIQDTKFRYEVTLNTARVLREALYEKRVKLSYLFEREWQEQSQQYKFKHQNFGEAAKIPLRQNASIISSALLQEHIFARKLDQYFSTYYGNVCYAGRATHHDADFQNILDTAQFFDQNKSLLDWVNQRLSHFDLGLEEIGIGKTKLLGSDGKENEVPFPSAIHLVSNQRYSLPLFEESNGTQALFVLLRYILPVLHGGGVAYIDEFEIGLHSHMIPRLIELFYSSLHNPKRAQLIFSCHSDYSLNYLEKYQIYLVQKDDECASQAWRLDEIKGVRPVDNIYAKYHGGAYGGVPRF